MTEKLTREQLQEQLNALRVADGWAPLDWEQVAEEFDHPLHPQQTPEEPPALIEQRCQAWAASTEQWRLDRINAGLALKSLRETFGLYFERDVSELPAGQLTELLRHLGALLRPYAPEAADILESTGAP